jgi:predicted phage-related endonuclease
MTAIKYTILEKYAEIKKQIKILEAQAKEMESEVIRTVDDVEGREKKIETTYGKFQLIGNVKWEYSPTLKDKESLVKEQIKLMKHKEESDGTAVKLSDGYILKCTLVKGE